MARGNCKVLCSQKGLLCNPASGRCVDPDGKIGRELQGRIANRNTRNVCPAAIQRQCKSEDKICNPKTRQCVMPHGSRGQKLLTSTHYVKHHDLHHVRGHMQTKMHKFLGNSVNSGKKFPTDVDREVKKTLRAFDEFEELYEEEHEDLGHNIKNGHKKGVLRRMFGAAKNSLAGLYSLARKHPAFAVLIIAAMVYGGGAVALSHATPTSPVAIALSHFTPTALGGLKPVEFIAQYGVTAGNFVRDHGGKQFLGIMGKFVGQLRGESGYLSWGWKVATMPIIKLWEWLGSFIVSSGISAGIARGLSYLSPSTPSTPSLMTPAHQPLLLHQSQSLLSNTPKGYYTAMRSGTSSLPFLNIAKSSTPQIITPGMSINPIHSHPTFISSLLHGRGTTSIATPHYSGQHLFSTPKHTGGIGGSY